MPGTAPRAVPGQTAGEGGNSYCRTEGDFAYMIISLLLAGYRGSSSSSARASALQRDLGRAGRRLEHEGIGVGERASVFHSLIRSVYCGAPVTVLLVITYLRGTGLAPVSTQICQSVSGVRNARCSHSTPSTTPCPICVAVGRRRHQLVEGVGQQEIGAGHGQASDWAAACRSPGRPCPVHRPACRILHCCRRARRSCRHRPARRRRSRRCA